MKFQNKLYNITSKEVSNYICYNIQLEASSIIYQAHFPGEPITPGVCIIQIAKELLEDSLGEDLTIKSVKNVKFLNIISPLKTPHITYIFEKIASDDIENNIKVVTRVKAANLQLAKLSFTCKQQ